jgi:hypothetical protein
MIGCANVVQLSRHRGGFADELSEPLVDRDTPLRRKRLVVERSNGRDYSLALELGERLRLARLTKEHVPRQPAFAAERDRLLDEHAVLASLDHRAEAHLLGRVPDDRIRKRACVSRPAARDLHFRAGLAECRVVRERHRLEPFERQRRLLRGGRRCARECHYSDGEERADAGTDRRPGTRAEWHRSHGRPAFCACSALIC